MHTLYKQQLVKIARPIQTKHTSHFAKGQTGSQQINATAHRKNKIIEAYYNTQLSRASTASISLGSLRSLRSSQCSVTSLNTAKIMSPSAHVVDSHHAVQCELIERQSKIPKITHRSIVLLDWDDTLFPTTALFKHFETLPGDTLLHIPERLQDMYGRCISVSNLYDPSWTGPRGPTFASSFVALNHTTRNEIVSFQIALYCYYVQSNFENPINTPNHNIHNNSNNSLLNLFPLQVLNELRKCASYILQLVSFFVQRNTAIFIITNADLPWVHMVSNTFYGINMWTFLQTNTYFIVSAKDLFTRYLPEPNLAVFWKFQIFQLAIYHWLRTCAVDCESNSVLVQSLLDHASLILGQCEKSKDYETFEPLLHGNDGSSTSTATAPSIETSTTTESSNNLLCGQPIVIKTLEQKRNTNVTFNALTPPLSNFSVNLDNDKTVDRKILFCKQAHERFSELLANQFQSVSMSQHSGNIRDTPITILSIGDSWIEESCIKRLARVLDKDIYKQMFVCKSIKLTEKPTTQQIQSQLQDLVEIYKTLL